MATQIRNDEMVELLTPDFDRRYEPNNAWRSACSSFLSIPALRGLWPMAGSGVSGQVLDISGLGNHLSLNGLPRFSLINLIPFVRYDGTGDYHNITDAASSNAFDILGTETYVATASRGMTIGCWCYPEETATNEGIITKYGAAGNRAYRLIIDSSDQFIFQVSSDGTNTNTATSAPVSVNNWYFIVGRFIPSSSLDIFVNNVEVNQATAYASLFNSSADLEMGTQTTGTLDYQGRISYAFMTPFILSNSVIGALFQQTRAMYGV